MSKQKSVNASTPASGSEMATQDVQATDSLRLVLQLEDTEANRFIMEQAHETLKRQVLPEAGKRAILKLEQIRLTSVMLPKYLASSQKLPTPEAKATQMASADAGETKSPNAPHERWRTRDARIEMKASPAIRSMRWFGVTGETYR